MISTGSLVIVILSLVTVAKSGGIGKAWEVSPISNTDNPSALSSRPRLESSAFEVRSVSGVGRMAPTFTDHEQIHEKSATETVEEVPSIAKEIEKNNTESVPKLREAKELEDLEPVTDFLPGVEFREPTVEEFFRKSKEATEVEALPSVWRKFRRHGRTGRNHGGHCSEVEEIDEFNTDENVEVMEEKSRIRREAEIEMEKIGGSKNVREGRLATSDSWSKQPLSIEFRHRTNLEESADEEEKSARSTDHGLQAPHVDFVTSNRRSFSENRQSRDMTMPPVSGRSYDEMPIYRNTLRDRELDVPYTRSLFYPERYRTERDYFVRATNDPIYQQDRNREVDFDLYGRSRPTMPKPKRIIYYATLPEIIRKPVDLRNYPRPYDVLTRSTNPVMAADGYYKRRSGSNDPTKYRHYAYPPGNYEQYDLFAKRPTWYDRLYGSYAGMEDSRRREQDLDHASMKENLRSEEAMLELGHDRKIIQRSKSRDNDNLPWPVQIGTEVNVKDNDRVTGRKIFGKRDDYDRFRDNDRMDREREQEESVEIRN